MTEHGRHIGFWKRLVRSRGTITSQLEDTPFGRRHKKPKSKGSSTGRIGVLMREYPHKDSLPSPTSTGKGVEKQLRGR